MKNHGLGIVIFCASLSAACVAQSQGVSLGDLARKNRAGDKKPAMVFNDDNMQRSAVTDDSSSEPDAGNSDQDVKAGDKQKQSSEQKLESKSSTASGADEKARLQKELDSLKKKQSVWSDSAKQYEEELANETSDFRRQVEQEALKNDTNNVRFYQQRIDQVQSELNKMQEPSHANVPVNDHNTGSMAAPSGSQP